MSELLRYSTPAERLRGCRWADKFESQVLVERNGGAISGAPAFSPNGVVLDGAADYMVYQLDSEIITTPELTWVVDFTPGFTPNDGTQYYFFDDSAGNFGMVISAGGILTGFIDGNVFGPVNWATYQPYWNVLDRNRLVLSASNLDVDVWLNGTQVLTTGATAFTLTVPTAMYVGARSTVANYFLGTIHSLQFYNQKLADQECEDLSNGVTYQYLDGATGIWPMDSLRHDPTNVRTLDISGNDNHAVFGDGATANTYPVKVARRRGYTLDGVNDYFSGMPVLPAAYTVTYAQYVGGYLTVNHENVNTFYNNLTTSGGFTGDVLFVSLIPSVLTAMQEADFTVTLQKKLYDV